LLSEWGGKRLRPAKGGKQSPQKFNSLIEKNLLRAPRNQKEKFLRALGASEASAEPLPTPFGRQSGKNSFPLETPFLFARLPLARPKLERRRGGEEGRKIFNSCPCPTAPVRGQE